MNNTAFGLLQFADNLTVWAIILLALFCFVLEFNLILTEGEPGWRDLAITVEPGITAMLAAAARLGAPLGGDFCALSLSDNLSLVRGRHSFKAGVEVRVVNSRRFQTGRPTHRYDNVAALIEDRPNNIQVIFGNPGLSLDTVTFRPRRSSAFGCGRCVPR